MAIADVISPETNNAPDGKKSPKRRFHTAKKIARWAAWFAATGVPVATIGDYWGRGTGEKIEDLAAGLRFVSKPDVSLKSTPETAQRDAKCVKDALEVDCAAYNVDPNNDGSITPLSPDEWLDKVSKDFEVLETYRAPETLGALHAVAFRQKDTRKIFVACTGIELGQPSKWVAGFYGGFRIAAGDVNISDLNHFKEFIDHIRGKYGKIEAVCGHSLGSVMACAINPYLQDLKEGTSLFVIDSPGIRYRTIQVLAKYWGKSEDEIRECFKQENVYSLILQPNDLNRLGKPPGLAYSLSPPPRWWINDSLIPLPLHHQSTTFALELDNVAAKIQPDTFGGIATGPTFWTAFLLATVAGANFRTLKKLPKLLKRHDVLDTSSLARQ